MDNEQVRHPLVRLLMPLVNGLDEKVSARTTKRKKKRLTGYHCVVTLIRLQRNLLDRLELRVFQFLHFGRKNGFRDGCRVDTAGFDGDDDVATVFEEGLCVVDDDTGLVGLRDVGEDDVHGG